MFPPFPTEKAHAHCMRIISQIENNELQLVQVSAPSAERDGHGIMIGVLVCHDSDGREVILKAVSGNSLLPQENSQERVATQMETTRKTGNLSPAENISQVAIRSPKNARELWVSPIVDASAIADALAPNDKKIHELTDELKLAVTDSERRRISAERAVLTTESLSKVHALYKFHTISGRVLSLKDICGGKLPPTGTGDCCAPKLLDYAFSHGLLPVSMDEIFYGKPQSQITSPKTAVLQKSATSPTASFANLRQSGKSYAPCDERCGIVLPAMLGLEIIYRDEDIIVVNKQSGLLSVPGIGAEKQDCVASRVRRLFPHCIKQPTVHRLDMETSGLLVLAFTAEAHRNLSIQFQEAQVQKKYTALLDGSLAEAKGMSVPKPNETHGVMTLYFRLDIDNRPHQIWDEVHGKKSITEWERLGFEWYHAPANERPAPSENNSRLANETPACQCHAPANERAAPSENRKVTRVLFTPHTGRTHQLRLAASDVHGFGLPIVGDMLYNERYKHLRSDKYEADFVPSERLCLHAHYLYFTHPRTGERMEFTSKVPF